MSSGVAVLLAAAALIAACTPGARAPSGMTPSPTPPGSPSAGTAATIVAPVTPEGLLVHLAALDAIARKNGGHRAVGSSGFDASVRYAEQTLAAAGYAVVRQEFEAAVFEDPGGNELTILGPRSRSFQDRREFISSASSVAGSADGRLVAVTDPCEPNAFDDVSSGSILIVRGSGCEWAATVAAGRAAALVVGSDMPSGALVRFPVLPGAPTIPVVIASADATAALEAAAGSNDGSSVHLRVTGATRRVTTSNVLAELRGSDPDRVVMIGAHLDSTIDGPGIDDDGTGVATVLELARSLAGTQPTATIRFALWSGEELGLLGATHYAATIPTAERDRIEVYLNADMLGARNGIRAVYYGGGFGKEIALARRLHDYFAQRNLPREGEALIVRTDAQAFHDAGIPSAGVASIADGPKTAALVERYGGSVGPMDACYHRPCDDLANIDLRLTSELADALASVLVDLADVQPEPGGSPLPGG